MIRQFLYGLFKRARVPVNVNLGGEAVLCSYKFLAAAAAWHLRRHMMILVIFEGSWIVIGSGIVKSYMHCVHVAQGNPVILGELRARCVLDFFASVHVHTRVDIFV